MIEQWTQRHPDLDSSSLGVLARISRLAHVADENAARILKVFNLTDAEFQLLAAIRTSPFTPSPRDLLDQLMVTSGGLTNRIDRLERAGFVERLANPQDRRGILLSLTDRGRALVDRVTSKYLANQHTILDQALDAKERKLLASLLRRLLESLSETPYRDAPEGNEIEVESPTEARI